MRRARISCRRSIQFQQLFAVLLALLGELTEAIRDLQRRQTSVQDGQDEQAPSPARGRASDPRGRNRIGRLPKRAFAGDAGQVQSPTPARDQLALPMSLTILASVICLTAHLFPPTAPLAAGPVCNAGGPYVAECNGPLASVQLDATASYEPHGLPLTFKWQIECGNGYLDDPTSPTPTLYHQMSSCSFGCGRVDLRVTAASGVSKCSTQVQFQDTVPPVITCPPNVSVLMGQPYDPSVTGFATASDTCSAAPSITWSDVVLPGEDPEVLVVVRTWTADDGCQASSCDQLITLAPYLIPHVDILPGQCPNPFFLDERAGAASSVPVSVLGNAFDPTEVDPSSLRMSVGLAPVDGEVDFIQPIQIALGDAGTPFFGPVCDCHTLGPDGLLDLNLRFSAAQMKFGLGLINEPLGSEVPLVISGLLLDGTPFEGQDCVLIQ